MIDTLDLLRVIKIMTATVLMPLLIVSSLPGCATVAHLLSPRAVSATVQRRDPPVSKWLRVEAVRVGTLIRVQLHDVDPRRGSRTIQGRFHSATADTLTLTLDEWSSPTYTVAQSAVYRVHARRPVKERSIGWGILGGTAVIVALKVGGEEDFNNLGKVIFGAMYTSLIGLPASLIGFIAQRWQQLYETLPAASRFIAQVDVPLADGAVVPRSRDVAISVTHASRLGRSLDETLGVIVCLSSQADRCTGARAVFEEPSRRLSSSVTAALRFEDETVPVDTPVPIYVHVVLTIGPSWQPSSGRTLPQLGDPGVLGVETVTRRITVVDQ